ncbi:hypothetical protein C6P45_004376 [Maudiozyma exigua]|uniref:Rad61 Wapl domain-containing protein n=1 Tax=Maudiozyma exigua TaxID=34358 RepID=A0A9P7BBN0_MAUEX|nr:hypothetical protein C6P45_004376 [Kazachstania exigua]
MKAYGRRSRTATTFSVSNNEFKDISFSQSEGEESDNILTDFQQKISERNIINEAITPQDNETNKLSNDRILGSGDIDSSFDLMETSPSSDINITSPPTLQISPRKTKLKAERIPELQAFDFLDNSRSIKRRRKTNYYKHIVSSSFDTSAEGAQKVNEADQNGDDSDGDVVYGSGNISSPMGKVLKNVGNFLMTLQPEHEHSLEDLFSDEKDPLRQNGMHNEKPSGAQKIYNNRRTLLMRNGTIEEEEQKMVDEYLEEMENDKSINDNNEDLSLRINRSLISKKNDKTHTFSEFKNISDSLQLQEDYNYLTSNLKSNTTTNEAISILAEFVIAINNDNDILNYIQKYHCSDICKWCLQIESIDDQLLILQGYILNIFYKQVPNTNIPNNLQIALINIAHCTNIPTTLRNGNKMQRLTYSDFLKLNNGKSGFHYALSIWHSSISGVSIDHIEGLLHLLIDIANKPGYELILDESKFFQLLQNVLLIYNNEITDCAKNEIDKICGLFESKTDLIDNEDYLKCVILVTNDSDANKKSKGQTPSKLCQETMNHALNNLNKANKTLENIILLQLALFLNIIDYYQPTSNELSSTISQLKSIVFQKDKSKQYSSMTDNLLHLIFAYQIIINKSKSNNKNIINKSQREIILENLRHFDKMGNGINDFVKAKINTAIAEIELYKM